MSQSFVKRGLTPRKGYEFWRGEFWFGQVDSRPLSVFRIVLALLLLKDAIYDLTLARPFYSDLGIVPRSALMDGLLRGPRFSLMDAITTPWMATLFFLIWIVVLVMLLLGYRAKLMSILNLIIILSIHERNVYILNGADTVFRVLSVWCIFLPLSHYYSIDALRGRLSRYRMSQAPSDLRAADGPRTAWAFPVRLIQLQIIVIYTFTGVLKVAQPSAWRDGTALYYALQLKSLTLPTGDWVQANVPLWMLSIMNYQTLVTEIGFVFFVMSPFFQPYLRITGLTLGVMLHGGIAVLMAISNFSPVMITTYLLFFEAGWIVWLDMKMRRLKPANLPSRMGIPSKRSPLYLLLAATREAELEMVWDEAQSQQFDSWSIHDQDGTILTGSAAWQRAAGHLPLSKAWALALRGALVRRALWAFFSQVATRAMIPLPDMEAEPEPRDTAPSLRARRLRTAGKAVMASALGGLMVMIVWWNLSGIQMQGKYVFPGVPEFVVPIVDYPGLWQSWDMFAPYPQNYDGWIVIPGVFEDGTTLDLKTGKPPTGVQPRTYVGTADRWKKFEDNIYREQYRQILFSWSAMYCRIYNDEGRLPVGKRLASLEIRYVLVWSHDPGKQSRPSETQMLWKHWCFAQYAY